MINIIFNDMDYKYESIFIILSYFIVLLIYSIAIIKDGFDIFQPLHFITILYICIFIFCPLYLIYEDRTTVNGSYIMDGCIKATTIYILSYASFVCGYLMKKAPKFCEFRTMLRDEFEKGFIQKLNILCFVIWFFGMIINLYYLIKSGMDIKYIFSFGQIGSYNLNKSLSEASFISNFGYFMIIPWLYILYYSKRKSIKIIISFITASIYLIRGFRFIIIIMILSVVLCYYRKKLKHPSIASLMSLLMLCIIFISILGFARHGLRTGYSANWENFNLLNEIGYALETNFNIYKPFYGLVTHYPAIYPYTLGKGMIWDTITHFIPRAIWNSKPLAKYSTMAIAMKNSTNDFTYDVAAMAWPNIGEYYMDFGIFGCIIFMFILGYTAKKMLFLFKSRRIDDVILYSVFFGFSMQIVIRGYSPINIGLFIFIYTPALLIRLYASKGKVNKYE